MNILLLLMSLFPIFYGLLIFMFFLTGLVDSYKRHRVHHIFEEVKSLYRYDFEYSCWNDILDEIYLHRGLFRKYYRKKWFCYFRSIKPYFSKELSDIVYTRALNSNLPFLNAYIYSFMQVSHSFSSGFFNYDFFQYCEEKLINDVDSEQGYMHLCLHHTLMDNKHFIDRNNSNYLKYNKCLALLCCELIFIEFPKYEFNLNRILSYVEKACDKIENDSYNIRTELIEELCNAYKNTLTNKKHLFLRRGRKNQYELDLET